MEQEDSGAERGGMQEWSTAVSAVGLAIAAAEGCLGALLFSSPVLFCSS